MCFSQTIVSKLAGKRIYLHRKDGTDHTDGFVGLQTFLNTKKAAYGYTLEASIGTPTEADLNNIFNRLYNASGTKPANAIGILILCQGQGDQNIGGGASVNPFNGFADRFGKV